MTVQKIKLADFITVQMECFHLRERKRKDAPPVGELMWCLRCHKDKVVTAHVEQYRLKCFTCRYGRLVGTRRSGAGYQGTKHWRKNPTHDLRMFVGTEEVRRWQPQEEKIFTISLPPGAVDTPPF